MISLAEQMSMRKAGFTYEEIGRKSNEPTSTIKSRLKRLGVEPEVKVIHSRDRRPKHDFPRWLIDEMYWDCELSMQDIAFELCISPHSVRTMMNRLHIERRSKGEGRRLHCARHPEAVEQFISAGRDSRVRATEASVRARARKKKVAERKRRWLAERPAETHQAELERRRVRREEVKREREAA